MDAWTSTPIASSDPCATKEGWKGFKEGLDGRDGWEHCSYPKGEILRLSGGENGKEMREKNLAACPRNSDGPQVSRLTKLLSRLNGESTQT